MRIWCLLVVAACGKDVAAVADAPAGDGNGGGGDGPAATIVQGTISSDQMWSGTVLIAADTTIAMGATVTVAAGTVIKANAATVNVDGKIDLEGTKTDPITLMPKAVAWGGFVVTGTFVMHYAVQTGGGIMITAGSVTVSDSRMFHDRDGRDFLIMDGGTSDVEYSIIGPAPGTTDLIHCDMHADPSNAQIKVVHTDLSSASFGMDMFGGATLDLTYNNWFSNQTDVYTQQGTPVVADVSFGWFESGKAPVAAGGSQITANSLSSKRRTDTGPR